MRRNIPVYTAMLTQTRRHNAAASSTHIAMLRIAIWKKENCLIVGADDLGARLSSIAIEVALSG